MSTSLCKTSVVRIYHEVIDDVIFNVRELFLEESVDEQVLQDLRQTWETKLMNSKAVQNEQEEKKKPPEVQTTNGFPKVQNNPIQAALPPQPMQQPMPQQIQHIVENKQVPIQITLPVQPGTDGPRILTIHVPSTALQGNQLQRVLTGPVITATMGLPVSIASSLLQQHVNAALNSQAQAQQSAVTIINKNLAQTDGAADCEEDLSRLDSEKSMLCLNDRMLDEQLMQTVNIDEPISIEIILSSHSKASRRNPTVKATKRRRTTLGQTDGPADTSDDDDDATDDEADADDDLDDDDKDADDEEMEEEGGEEEPLNSEDDVTDDDPTDLFETDNIVVCQYDKIIRNRNKWKFYLKDGIMNLNGQDYVFQKATGDAEW